MTSYTKSTALTKPEGMQRWELIMALPENTALLDISTGENYRRRQFRPVHKDGLVNTVESFSIDGSENLVHVAFLRLAGDKARNCTLRQNNEAQTYHQQRGNQ